MCGATISVCSITVRSSKRLASILVDDNIENVYNIQRVLFKNTFLKNGWFNFAKDAFSQLNLWWKRRKMCYAHNKPLVSRVYFTKGLVETEDVGKSRKYLDVRRIKRVKYICTNNVEIIIIVRSMKSYRCIDKCDP